MNIENIDEPGIYISSPEEMVAHLRKAMEVHGLNQHQMAFLMRTTQSTISALLTGKLVPSGDSLVSLRIRSAFETGFGQWMETVIKSIKEKEGRIFPTNRRSKPTPAKQSATTLFQKYNFLSVKSRRAVENHIEMAFKAESQ